MSELIQNILNSTKDKISLCLTALSKRLNGIRAGQVHTMLLENMQISVYESNTPISSLANISVLSNNILEISVYDKNNVTAIEKAITGTDLGLSCSTSGLSIHAKLAPLDTAQRMKFAKLTKSEGDDAKISTRRIRRDAISQCETLEKQSEISEDELRKAKKDIQTILDESIQSIDQRVKIKILSITN